MLYLRISHNFNQTGAGGLQLTPLSFANPPHRARGAKYMLTKRRKKYKIFMYGQNEKKEDKTIFN